MEEALFDYSVVSIACVITAFALPIGIFWCAIAVFAYAVPSSIALQFTCRRRMILKAIGAGN